MKQKMYNIDYYKEYSKTHPFGEDRTKMYEKFGCKNGKHEGDDFGSNNMKNIIIFNQFSGVTQYKAFDKNYGNYIQLIHNPKYIGGADENFFSQYCHLSEFNKKLVRGFCQFGTVLGIMGNTGNSFGVHLHFMCYQNDIEENQVTSLLNDILEKTKHDDLLPAIWQFHRLFFNPEIIKRYFIQLQGE